MDIMDLISGQLDNQYILNQLGKSSGSNPTQVQQLIKLGLPTLLKALTRNASSLMVQQH